MTEATEHIEQPAGTTAEEADRTAWQTPGYTVVDTALEVTAYSLSVR
ncbi:pyrroloquinoline quinone precursor peptide PqqA [Streptomyces sp. Ag109_G2-15]|nr:pyrroloquinoline quinone precursor peptide PqqA [Streptomyces sp. Ag109_G2-15]SOD88719.1 coenzyme PQQ precursor peptide PqqA [Streptomyces sp. Ag109_G2-15]